jgi:nicotinamide mononucleotide adenylyltransferase
LPRPIIMASNQPSQTASTPAAQNYAFPHSRLRLRQNDPSRTPLVLVACGSYSPVTHLHLRMFEMASDFVRFNTNFELLGGYFSPVSDQYRKAGLASAVDRYLNPASYMYSN